MSSDSDVDIEGCEMEQPFLCGVVEGFYGRPWTTEQRRHLFGRLKTLGLNTYLYAPKDDLKHRCEWRTLYNTEESELLGALIRSAREHGINFVYSLSPGIDIIYSDQNEVLKVEEKLCQVRDMGCDAFALLFDDIETTMNEADKMAFPSFAAAQIAVTNRVFRSMGAPMFLFCPTEYCSTRAVPELETSDYLNFIGENLLPEIHIMWTGPQVVTWQLTVEHSREIAKVLRRRPLIWDNLHANDYDPRRVFLGPFKDRSVELKRHLAGVLLNPNCKYEANFVPINTMAAWNRAEIDAENDEEMDPNGAITYNPKRALAEAVEEWLKLFDQGPGPAIPPSSHIECTLMPLNSPTMPEAPTSLIMSPPTIRTCEANELLITCAPTADTPIAPLYTSAPIGNATTVTVPAFPLEEPMVICATANPTSAQMVEASTLSPKEPVAVEIPPITTNSLVCAYSEAMADTLSPTEETVATESGGDSPMLMSTTTATTPNEDRMDVESGGDVADGAAAVEKAISHERVALLVDIFYLPFEYGPKALQLLDDFQWMHQNAHILRQQRDADTIDEWLRRYQAFQMAADELEIFFRAFIDSPNRSLVQELFAYVSEAHGVVATLAAVAEWMRGGHLFVVAPATADAGWWHRRQPNVEPWSFGNGLLPDLNRLIAPSAEAASLVLTAKPPIPVPIGSYRIRPLLSRDSLNPIECYELFATAAEKLAIEKIFAETPNPQLAAADFFVRSTLDVALEFGAPPHHFRVDELNATGQPQLFGIVCAAFSMCGAMDDVRRHMSTAFRREMIDKGANTATLDAYLSALPLCRLPTSFLQRFPSFVEIRWRDHIAEASWMRRAFHAAASALALNGSNGLFTLVADESHIQLYHRFGLCVVNDMTVEGAVVMGHLLQMSD